MDRIRKFLARLSQKEQIHVEKALEVLRSGLTHDLNIKKLKGFEDIFRLRVQSIRIIYRKRGTTIQIVEMSRRSEDTYKNL